MSKFELGRSAAIDALNINLTLGARSKQNIERGEITVLSVCAGKRDHFTKTVLRWLHRCVLVRDVNIIQCGPAKHVDDDIKSSLSQSNRENNKDSSTNTARTRFHYKLQTNLPTEAQWRIFPPHIVLFCLQNLTQSWCIKNQKNLFSFEQNPRFDTSEDENSKNDSGDEADNESETDNDRLFRRLATKNVAGSVKTWDSNSRPTIHQSQVLKRTMLLHFLSLIALHRPKIVFINNTHPKMWQGERRKADFDEWMQMLCVIQCFGSETGYRVRTFHLEMSQDKTTAQNPEERITCCNAVVLERADNGKTTQSTHFYQTCCAQNDNSVINAARWLFYDIPATPCCLVHSNRQIQNSGGKRKRAASTEQSKTNEKTQRRVPWRRRVNKSNADEFPRCFSQAAAHFAVAQVTETLKNTYNKF